jgi:hypothetical protein
MKDGTWVIGRFYERYIDYGKAGEEAHWWIPPYEKVNYDFLNQPWASYSVRGVFSHNAIFTEYGCRGATTDPVPNGNMISRVANHWGIPAVGSRYDMATEKNGDAIIASNYSIGKLKFFWQDISGKWTRIIFTKCLGGTPPSCSDTAFYPSYFDYFASSR